MRSRVISRSTQATWFLLKSCWQENIKFNTKVLNLCDFRFSWKSKNNWKDNTCVILEVDLGIGHLLSPLLSKAKLCDKERFRVNFILSNELQKALLTWAHIVLKLFNLSSGPIAVYTRTRTQSFSMPTFRAFSIHFNRY